MSMNPGARTDANAEMNVTPLIDVLLVLLIIFMVLLPHHRRGEPADIPQQTEPQQVLDPEAPIVIQLLDSGEGKVPNLAINRREVTWDALDLKLREIYLKRVAKVAFLKGDPEVEFQYMAEVLDMAHHAG